MASSSIKLVLEFEDAGGNSRKWNFNYASEDIEADDVKALMQSMITNGSIFAHPPVKAVNAALVVTTSTGIEIDS